MPFPMLIAALLLLLLPVIKDVLNSRKPSGFSWAMFPTKPTAFAEALMIPTTFGRAGGNIAVPAGRFMFPVSKTLPLPSSMTNRISLVLVIVAFAALLLDIMAGEAVLLNRSSRVILEFVPYISRGPWSIAPSKY